MSQILRTDHQNRYGLVAHGHFDCEVTYGRSKINNLPYTQKSDRDYLSRFPRSWFLTIKVFLEEIFKTPKKSSEWSTFHAQTGIFSS